MFVLGSAQDTKITTTLWGLDSVFPIFKRGRKRRLLEQQKGKRKKEEEEKS